MILTEEDRALVGAVLPANTSLTHFTDFRCGHGDLAALLERCRHDAYQRGWNDREADLLAAAGRILPAREQSRQPQEGAGQGEAVAWRVKDFADGWVLFHSEIDARREAEGAGNLVQPLFATQAELDRLRDRVAALGPFFNELLAEWGDPSLHHPDLFVETPPGLEGPVTYGQFAKAIAALAALNPQTGEAAP